MIHVVAGAVTRADGRVLIAQRPPGKQLAGSWEFPGGKLEPGEARAAGLARELQEELDITIRDPRPLVRVRHTYPYGEVLIDMWVVTRYAGEPRGLDGQSLRWCTQDELATADLLPADRPIVRALRLPERLTAACTPYYDIGESRMRIDRKLCGVLCSTVEEAVSAANGDGRPDFLVMRRELPAEHLQHLCESVPVPVFARGIRPEAAWVLGASGISMLDA
ncbi:MAG: NUDIX domain-containing protein [Steroidobacteraceae bacterium]